ncbi:MAG: hypothetical protein LAT75_11775 [Candidatus Cyclonatronum sp.]|uniref:sensor histidine kinase n=1 Tax=Cyclonatronum sp. TaxID=3024185 RepID=UPI0025C72E67|nr:ATP-binding protein [Cyclonatronum sp.]MCH8487537.1 hypothetical protein [Cyclonatronum sp.]
MIFKYNGTLSFFQICLKPLFFLFIVLLYFSYSKVYAFGNSAGNLFGQGSPYFLTESWGVIDGLPVDSVVDLTQCDRGFIWLTTYEGIVRFDGFEFRVYNTTTNPELTTNRFTWIERDENDPSLIWIVPEYGGLVLLENGTFRYFDDSNGFTDAISVRPVYWNETTVFGTYSGVFVYNHTEGKMEQFSIENSDSLSSYITWAVVGGNGKLYLTTLKEIIVLDPEFKVEILNFENYHPDRLHLRTFDDGMFIFVSNKLYVSTDNELVRLDFDLRHKTSNGIGKVVSENRLYFSSETGMSVFDINNNFRETYVDINHLEIGLLSSVVLDFDSYNYLITRKGYTISFKNDEEIIPEISSQSIQSGISRYLLDRDGNIWFSTFLGGLVRLTRPVASSLRTDTAATDDRLIGIYEDNEGNFWISTRRSKVYRVSESGISEEIQIFSDLISGFEIYAFATGADGAFYAGLNRWGIGRLGPDGFFELLDLGFPVETLEIRALHITDDGILWVGLFDGLVKLKNGVSVNFPCEEELHHVFVQQIIPVESGGIWLTSLRRGVFYINTKTGSCRNYTVADGLGNNSVRGVYPDRYDAGTVWFATEGGGLSRLRDGEFRTISSANGLHRDLLHNVIEDYNGRLWMSTNQGIFFVNKAEVNRFMDGEMIRIRPTVFTEREGLANAEGNGGFQNSFVLRENGDLFFSTQTGLAFFRTSQIQENVRQPVPVIDSFLTSTGVYELPDKIVLQPGENDFTITYTGINFDAPRATQFWYKLDGYDEFWNLAGTRRAVSYTNLPPRSYTFRLSTTDPTDPAADPAAFAQLVIIKEPHFFQTWWFRVLSLIFGVVLLINFYRYRIRAFERQERLLMDKVDERTRELQAEKEAALLQQQFIEIQAADLRKLNQEKDRFFSIIAHDLRGPFSGIRGLIDLLLEHRDELDEEKFEEVLSLLKGSADNHSELLENLLGWARIQLKHIKPVLKTADASDKMNQAARAWELPAKNKNITLVFRLESFKLLTDQNMLDAILRNLIHNAIKFSWPQSEIILRCYTADNQGIFEIQDFGTGMSVKQLENLFTLNKEVSHKGTQNEAGSGLGLVLISEMVKVLNGRIEAQSEKGKGTLMRVSFPLGAPQDAA